MTAIRGGSRWYDGVAAALAALALYASLAQGTFYKVDGFVLLDRLLRGEVEHEYHTFYLRFVRHAFAALAASLDQRGPAMNSWTFVAEPKGHLPPRCESNASSGKFRVRDGDGKAALLLWSGLHPARLSRSDDDGATWSELTPAGTFGGIVVMGDLVPTTRPSAYVAWFHDDGRFRRGGGESTGTFTLLQTESADGGRTWSEPRTLWSGSDLHLCEPGAVRSPDGKELTLLLRENARKQASHRMTSRDECATWSEPQPLHPALTGDRHTARYASDGRLVVVFRDMNLAPGHPTKGDFVAWVGTYADLAARAPGQYVVRLLDNHHAWDCGYAGLEVLPDGAFVATTYGHWQANAKPYIVSLRFTLTELDARAAAAPAQSDGKR